MEHRKALMHLQHAANNFTNVMQHKFSWKKSKAFGVKRKAHLGPEPNATPECSMCHATALDYVCECKHPKHAMCRSCMENIQKGDYLRCPHCKASCIQSYKQVYKKQLIDHHIMDTNAESDKDDKPNAESDNKHPNECIVCYGTNADYTCESQDGLQDNKEAMCRSCMQEMQKEKKGSCVRSYKQVYTKEVTHHEKYHFAGIEINYIFLMFQILQGCTLVQTIPRGHHSLAKSLKRNLITAFEEDPKVIFATNCSFTFRQCDHNDQTLFDLADIRNDINMVIIEIHSPKHPRRDKEFPKELGRVINNWIGDNWYLRSSNDEQLIFKFVIIFFDEEMNPLTFALGRNLLRT